MIVAKLCSTVCPARRGACPAAGVHDGSASWGYHRVVCRRRHDQPKPPDWLAHVQELPGVVRRPLGAEAAHVRRAPTTACRKLNPGRTIGRQIVAFVPEGLEVASDTVRAVTARMLANAPCPVGVGRLHLQIGERPIRIVLLRRPDHWEVSRKRCRAPRTGFELHLGGQVNEFSKFSNHKSFHSERVTAIHNQAAPGGLYYCSKPDPLPQSTRRSTTDTSKPTDRSTKECSPRATR